MPEKKDASYVPALRFRWLTPFYDAVVGITVRERTFKKALLQQAAIQPGQRVLDVGCGTGTLCLLIKQTQPQAEVVGVDGDPEILALAQNKARKAGVAVQFDHGLSTELPYPDAYFDRVLSTLFFHHLSPEDKKRTAAELFRVLKPGGELHIADWGKAANPLMRGLFWGIQILDGFENTRDNINGKLPDIFREAGFGEVQQMQAINTLFGTMILYRGVKPS